MNFEDNHIFLINTSFLHDQKVKNSALSWNTKHFLPFLKDFIEANKTVFWKVRARL